MTDASTKSYEEQTEDAAREHAAANQKCKTKHAGALLVTEHSDTRFYQCRACGRTWAEAYTEPPPSKLDIAAQEDEDDGPLK